MRLSIQCRDIPPWLRDGVLSSNFKYVKLVDPPPDNPFPGKRIIGSTTMPESDRLISMGKWGAEKWVSQFAPIYEACAYVYAWEGPNSPYPLHERKFRERLDEFTLALVNLMHGRGWKLVGVNAAAGLPPAGSAADMAQSIRACDFLGLQEYSAPAMWDMESWYCLRYRRLLDELLVLGVEPKVIITGCGLDGQIIDQPELDWKGLSQSEAHYLEQLAWYDRALVEDGIEAAFLTGYDQGILDALVNLSWKDEPKNRVSQPEGDTPPIVDLVGKLPLHPDPSNRYRVRDVSAIKMLVVHHSGPPGRLPISTEEYCRRIAANDILQGYAGSTYHHVIGHDGTICKVNRAIDAAAHAAQFNAMSIGVCLLGDFRPDKDNRPTEAQLAALTKDAEFLCGKFKIDKRNIKGHRSLMRTSCPGGVWFEEWLAEFQTR